MLKIENYELKIMNYELKIVFRDYNRASVLEHPRIMIYEL